jgi:hypothetical protein
MSKYKMGNRKMPNEQERDTAMDTIKMQPMDDRYRDSTLDQEGVNVAPHSLQSETDNHNIRVDHDPSGDLMFKKNSIPLSKSNSQDL